MEKRERDIESGLRKSVERMGGKFMKFTSPGNDGDRIKTMLLRIGGWKSGSKLEKVPGYGPQRCYHRCTGND